MSILRLTELTRGERELSLSIRFGDMTTVAIPFAELPQRMGLISHSYSLPFVVDHRFLKANG